MNTDIRFIVARAVFPYRTQAATTWRPADGWGVVGRLIRRASSPSMRIKGRTPKPKWYHVQAAACTCQIAARRPRRDAGPPAAQTPIPPVNATRANSAPRGRSGTVSGEAVPVRLRRRRPFAQRRRPFAPQAAWSASAQGVIGTRVRTPCPAIPCRCDPSGDHHLRIGGGDDGHSTAAVRRGPAPAGSRPGGCVATPGPSGTTTRLPPLNATRANVGYVGGDGAAWTKKRRAHWETTRWIVSMATPLPFGAYPS